MKIIKDSAIYVIGEVLAKLMPFLLMPYLTRQLGVAGFGELSYYQTLIVLLVIFIGLSQDGAITRYFYRYGKRSLGLVVLAGFFYSTIITLLFLGVALFFNSLIIIYVLFSAFFQSLMAAQLSIRQCQRQAVKYTILQLFSSVLSILITILLFEYVAGNTLMRIIAIFLSNAMGVAFGFYFFIKDGAQFNFKLKEFYTAVAYIFSFGLPLIFHHMSFFIKGQLDRVIIADKFSYTDLGIYAAAAQLAMIFVVCLQAINKAIVPYFYEALKKKSLSKENVIKYSIYSFLIVPIPALIALVIPNSVYLLFLGQQFDGAKFYTVMFLIGFGVNIPYLILVNYLFFHAKNKQIAIVTFISSLIYLIIFYSLTYVSLYYVPLSILISNILVVFIFILLIKQDKKQYV